MAADFDGSCCRVGWAQTAVFQILGKSKTSEMKKYMTALREEREIHKKAGYADLSDDEVTAKSQRLIDLKVRCDSG